MDSKTVFYAWQAQHPAKCNRSLIEEALKRALKELAQLENDPVEFTLDQDTRGVAGAREISAIILQKIEDCSVFVADITPVGSLINGKSTPNPNVLFELATWSHFRVRSLGLVQSKTLFKMAPIRHLPRNLAFSSGALRRLNFAQAS